MDTSDEQRIPGSQAGDQVGLGRVVENRTSAGSPDADDPGAGRVPGSAGEAGEPALDEASEDSFPASDPPTFMSDVATPRDPARTELPRPDEVP